jgi:two-component sensor histidine kinase
VTEVRRLEKELRRLMDELQHRVKNTLATVASIVNQTVATKGNVQDLVDTLKKRIGALAATHHLLTGRDWHDASLHQIIETELRPFDHPERVHVSGPPVALPPKHALTLTLTLHELATNAAKYGALAHPTGHLTVDWAVTMTAEGRRLSLDWRETGVSVGDPGAVRESFGTRLIKNAVVHDLQGSTNYALTSEGVIFRLEVPF